jgi:peptide/nickel transport system substrate-binding protein
MRKVLRVAIFSVDPPGLTLFNAFDPESFSVIPAINDALVLIDEDGAVQPALATSWSRIAPDAWEFELRDGVHFHNGEPFDADAVVASFEAHFDPTPSALALGALGTLRAIHKLDRLRVRLETHMPDTMLLRRLFFLHMYPPEVLRRSGRAVFEQHPIGTGAYRFVSYERGRQIVLARNPEHWADVATVDELRLPILRQKEWVHRLTTGQLDVAFNLDSHDCLRAQRASGVRGGSREADLSQLFLLRHEGPLADVRVRRALNHAVNRRILVDLTEHGLGVPQRSVASRVTEGYVVLEPYRYSPELARRLLSEAGYEGGFSLRGLVSETSTALYFAVREFLSRIDVKLEAEIVPRATWMQLVIGGNVAGRPIHHDFAVTSCDNPLLHALFAQHVFFASTGVASLTRDPQFDALLQRAATAVDAPLEAIAELERYNRDQAMMLYTVQQHVHAAWREGVEVVLPRSGHFDATAFWKLRVIHKPSAPGWHHPDHASLASLVSLPPSMPTPSLMPKYRPTLPDDGRVSLPTSGLSLPPTTQPPVAELRTLLDATSHTGAFYMPQGAVLSEPTARRIWTNLTQSEQRWRMQNEPMLRELVSSIEARQNLSNVLDSTSRVGIVGFTREGRLLFKNRGFELMFGAGPEVSLGKYLGHDGERGLDAIERKVDEGGVWMGHVHVPRGARPVSAPEDLFLTVSVARDEDGTAMGYTFVFSDFSGEEERIRTAAVRTILEHVPYGLFVVSPTGLMREGYSDACRSIFPRFAGRELRGVPLAYLLGLDPRRAEHFNTALQQVFDDVLPAEVSLGQLPQRVVLAERTFAMHGSVIRSEAGEVSGVLFTLGDISAQVTAEREAEHHRATVTILRFREAFETFARGLMRDLDALIADAQPGEARTVRALLHTAKGVLAQFSLTDLATLVHTIEDMPSVTTAALQAFRAELVDVLKGHGLDLEQSEAHHHVSDGALMRLLDDVCRHDDPVTMRRALAEALDRLREKPASSLIGPLMESAEALALRHGKTVRVRLIGGDVPISPRHAGVLASLAHLVRNAVHHGIEPSEQRGDKDPVAHLTLAFASSDDGLRIVVADDGCGIDTYKLVRQAVARGLLRAEDAMRMTRAEQLALVFRPGLSTADEVCETAGRGVGAGATRDAVEAVGGSIAIESRLGEGTAYTITLPSSPPHQS